MGFGQYTAQNSRPRKRDQGFPSLAEAQANARTSYIRKDDQLAHETENVVWSRKRGKTATVYKTESGRLVWRLYDTNVVEVDPSLGSVILRTGGWHTRTTRDNMEAALEEFFDCRVSVWGNKGEEEGRNLLILPDTENIPFDDRKKIPFDESVAVDINVFGKLQDPEE